jgi:hypothetical protein
MGQGKKKCVSLTNELMFIQALVAYLHFLRNVKNLNPHP